nr:DNA repair protein RadA [Spirochaetota bacterium]
MAKSSSVFLCAACGFESSRWLGRCPECGEWNSFSEEHREPPAKHAKQPARGPIQPVALSSILTVDHPR